MASIDFSVRDQPIESFFPVPGLCSGRCCLSLGIVGDRGNGRGLAFHLGFFTWAGRLLLQHHLPMLRVAPADFEPQRLFMRSMYLLVMGLLLGYLAEQQKQLRAEKAVVAR